MFRYENEFLCVFISGLVEHKKTFARFPVELISFFIAKPAMIAAGGSFNIKSLQFFAITNELLLKSAVGMRLTFWLKM